MSVLLHWLLTAGLLLLIGHFVPGIHVAGIEIALIAALVLTLVNLIVKPIVGLFTLPINLLTLGLFSFVINAAMFGLAAWFVPGFEVSNFLAALLGSVLLGILTGLMSSILPGFGRA
ncbi:MAG: phage holin family protein [Candidatus Melainabacteria bacterium]|nr:phage holin family protein [Candidatus Melainabacteria bacterium]